MLKRLQDTVIANGNVFEVLIDAVRVCSLGQITDALFAGRRAVPEEHVARWARSPACASSSSRRSAPARSPG